MKFRPLALLPFLTMLAAQPASAAGVVINNAPLQVDPSPIIQDGRVFVPLRGIFEALGASVVYDNRSIEATRGETTVALKIGSSIATVSGQQETVDTPPFIVGASTYVPLRFIAQSLGDYVSYDNATSTVDIVRHFARPVAVQAAPATVVEVAPPPLQIEVQPPCPAPNYLWMPGHWRWNGSVYFWIPGRWAPPPAYGLVWTPGYWGWQNGFYAWHEGYWATDVGFYGGINYGFGYFGRGFAGGLWVGNAFRYNAAVVHVDPARVTNVYVDRDISRYTVDNSRPTIVNNSTTVINTTENNRVSYNGGPAGVHARPTEQEAAVTHERHYAVPQSERPEGSETAPQSERMTVQHAQIRRAGPLSVNRPEHRPAPSHAAHKPAAHRSNHHGAYPASPHPHENEEKHAHSE